MQGSTREKIQMGRRVLDFGHAHPDASAGHGAALARLEERLVRADWLAAKQLGGFLQVRTASTRQRNLRRTMAMSHLHHLATVARHASAGAPELERKFTLTCYGGSFLAFHAEARVMAAEAAARRELLVAHGLSELVLDDLEHTLDKFENALEQADAGRRTHVGATAELIRVALDIVDVVRTMDGLNRQRFADDAETLARWERASSVAPPPTGEVQPAA